MSKSIYTLDMRKDIDHAGGGGGGASKASEVEYTNTSGSKTNVQSALSSVESDLGSAEADIATLQSDVNSFQFREQDGKAQYKLESEGADAWRPFSQGSAGVFELVVTPGKYLSGLTGIHDITGNIVNDNSRVYGNTYICNIEGLGYTSATITYMGTDGKCMIIKKNGNIQMSSATSITLDSEVVYLIATRNASGEQSMNIEFA